MFAGPEWVRIAASIPRTYRAGCTPDEDSCMPVPGKKFTACNPDSDGSDCAPAESDACEPHF